MVGIRVWQSNLPAKVVDLNKLLQIRVNYDNSVKIMFLIKNVSNRLQDRGIYVIVIPPMVHVWNWGSRPFNLIPTCICLLNSYLPKEN